MKIKLFSLFILLTILGCRGPIDDYQIKESKIITQEDLINLRTDKTEGSLSTPLTKSRGGQVCWDEIDYAVSIRYFGSGTNCVEKYVDLMYYVLSSYGYVVRAGRYIRYNSNNGPFNHNIVFQQAFDYADSHGISSGCGYESTLVRLSATQICEGDNNGGGGTPGQSNNTLTKPPSKDPCGGRASINERLNLSQVQSRNSDLLTIGSNEHGYESVLNMTNKTLSNNALTTDNLPNKITLSTNWTDNTITVGYTHNHPLDNAHSPSDLFFGVGQYSNMPAAQKQVFADYFTSTIITSENTYVVTIKDVDKWLAYGTTGLADEYASYNDQVRSKENLYWQDRTLLSPDSRLAVLLEMFGDAINIYRKDESGNFAPVSLNSRALVNPC